MENRCFTAVLLITVLFVCSNALPARKRMIYYQQAAVPAQYYAAPQRMMYVHYMTPSDNNGRSAQAASALVAGDTVATGTYLEDCNQAEAEIAAAGPTVQQGEDVLSAAGVHSSQSVAEAYPDDSGVSAAAVPPSRDLTVQVENESTGSVIADLPSDEQDAVPNPVNQSDDESKVPREYNFEANEPVEAVPPPAEAELPAPAPLAPVAATPGRRYLSSKKKVYVEVDHASGEASDVQQPAEAENAIALNDDEVQEEEEEEEGSAAAVVPVAPRKPIARRPAVKKPSKPAADCTGCAKAGSSGSSSSKPQIPAGTFFPIDFGGTAGGAIAIANSFSTGEGGSATSHAIAYGSPDAARGRVRPSKLH